MTQAVIVAATRTPIAKFRGSLSNIEASNLSALLVKKILQDTKVDQNKIAELVIGHVIQAGCGQNTARQTVLKSGLSEAIPASTLNQVCGSGLRAVAEAAKTVALGGGHHLTASKDLSHSDPIILAGGHENMSIAPHFIRMRDGYKMDKATLFDAMIKDGLSDALDGSHMGITAENLVAQYQISRLEQDEFALYSHEKAAAAVAQNFFQEEITPIEIADQKRGETFMFRHDESIRRDITLAKLSQLRGAFIKDGSVTAGNSSSLNDGAAMVMVTSEQRARDEGLEILAFVRSFAQSGVAPRIMGIGPVTASKLAMAKAGWNDIDLIEANEAFAAQSIAVNREMGWDLRKVNVHGGAVALGHPIGASGCRILVTLIHALRRRGGGRGLATLCAGGGMGFAMCVECFT